LEAELLKQDFKAAMSNSNGLLGQKSCRYHNQGRTFYNINEGRTLNGLL